MGTNAHIVIDGGLPDLAVFAERYLRRAEARWSRFLFSSELSTVNRNAGSLTLVSPDTFELIDLAVQGWHLTGGSFDPTVGAALCGLGYDRTFDDIIDGGSDIEDNPAPGCGDILLFRSLFGVQIAAGTKLDLGGLGKGFAADWLVKELLGRGARGACVSIGGDVRVDGESFDGSPWTVGLVGIDSHCPFRRIALRSGGVCTSSSQRRRWLRGSSTVHHLIAPEFGRPVENGLAKVTVVGATATQAEVLTKAVFVAGPDQGRQLLERLGVAGVLICDDKTLIEVGNLEDMTE